LIGTNVADLSAFLWAYVDAGEVALQEDGATSNPTLDATTRTALESAVRARKDGDRLGAAVERVRCDPCYNTLYEHVSVVREKPKEGDRVLMLHHSRVATLGCEATVLHDAAEDHGYYLVVDERGAHHAHAAHVVKIRKEDRLRPSHKAVFAIDAALVECKSLPPEPLTVESLAGMGPHLGPGVRDALALRAYHVRWDVLAPLDEALDRATAHMSGTASLPDAAMPTVTVSSGSVSVGGGLVQNWTTRSSRPPCEEHPHWMELRGAHPGAPVGCVRLFLPDAGASSPQCIVVRRRVRPATTWTFCGRFGNLFHGSDGCWVTLLSAADAGLADAVRIEVVGNYRGGLNTRIVALDVGGAPGWHRYAELREALTVATDVKVTAKEDTRGLCELARTTLSRLRVKVMEDELSSSVEHDNACDLRAALDLARVVDVDKDLIGRREADLVRLEARVVQRAEWLIAMESHKAERLALADLLRSADATGCERQGTFDAYRVSLGALYRDALHSEAKHDAPGRLEQLQSLLGEAESCVFPLVKDLCPDLVTAVATTRFRLKDMQREEERRKERVRVGVPEALPPPPKEYVCPITLDVMREPAMAADGFVYEKDAIERWLVDRVTSPCTNAPLAHLDVTVCQTMRTLIGDWPVAEHERLMTAHAKRKREEEEE
jgi:hypothetical protein